MVYVSSYLLHVYSREKGIGGFITSSCTDTAPLDTSLTSTDISYYIFKFRAKRTGSLRSMTLHFSQISVQSNSFQSNASNNSAMDEKCGQNFLSQTALSTKPLRFSRANLANWALALISIAWPWPITYRRIANIHTLHGRVVMLYIVT